MGPMDNLEIQLKYEPDDSGPPRGPLIAFAEEAYLLARTNPLAIPDAICGQASRVASGILVPERCLHETVGLRLSSITHGHAELLRRDYADFGRLTGVAFPVGKADLIFIGDSDIQVFPGVGNGLFSDRVLTQASGGHSGESRSLADVNGDQRTDILYLSASRITVLLDQGNGGFGSEFTTTASGLGTAEGNRLMADVDGDGRSDLMIVEDAAFKVLRSKGDGTFATANHSQPNH